MHECEYDQQVLAHFRDIVKFRTTSECLPSYIIMHSVDKEMEIDGKVRSKNKNVK